MVEKTLNTEGRPAGESDPHWRRVRDRAYAMWEEEGQPEGRALNHWLRAKWEIEQGHKTGAELERLEGEFESMRRPD